MAFYNQLTRLLPLCLASWSIPALGGAGWTDSVMMATISQQPSQIDGILVALNLNVTTNPSGCSASNGFYLQVVDDRTKRLFATLLAAQIAGQPIKVFVTGTCGLWGYAQIDAILTGQ